MSDVAITTTDYQGEGAVPPAPPQGHQLWNHVRRFGYILLSLELVAHLVWSTILYQHFALTADFAGFNQALTSATHGNFAPYSTVWGRTYLRQDAEFLPFVLLPLWWIFHAAIMLKWVQDLSLGGAELVAFTWLCAVARRHCPERDATWMAGLGLLMLLASPWLWMATSFDMHEQPLAIFFATFLAWDLSRGKRRAWVWAALVMLGGAPTTTWVLGLGLGGILAGRRTRRLGVAITETSIAYMLILGLVHGDDLASGNMQHFITLMHGNPFRPIEIVWSQWTDTIANLAPGGLVGVGAPLILPLALCILVPDALAGPVFTQPSFQCVALYVLLPVGTVTVLAWLHRRHRRATLVLAGIAAAQAIGWAVIWGPLVPGQWLRISNSAAATLASVEARIPASAEVVASQGVVGRFGQRAYVYTYESAGTQIPLRPDTWFIITPTSGIETTSSPTSDMALIGELAGRLHARLVTHANGVWVFRLAEPPPGITSVTVPGDSSPLPAWARGSAASTPVLDGSVSDWHVAATGAKGYVSDGLEWLEIPGRYRAEVTLSASGAPVIVEVWDNTITSTLLARQAILPTGRIQQILLPVTVSARANATAFGGWGPFRANFVAPPTGQRIEVRVWSPGGVAVNVYSAELTTPIGSAIHS